MNTRLEDKSVFRADMKWLANGPVLKLEGRLGGDWVEHARSMVTRQVVPKGLRVDLTDVTFVDPLGEQLLNWFNGVGAQFVARSIYALGVCERLHLPLDETLQGAPEEQV